MEVVLVKENETIQVLEGEGKVSGYTLDMRSRFAGSDIEYYILDFDPSKGIGLDAYIEVINQFPNLLQKSEMIRKI